MLSQTQLNQLFQEHETSQDGLTANEVQKRHLSFGFNEITEKKRRSLILTFLEEFKDILVIILIIACILAYTAGETIDAAIILFIVLLNAAIGFTQKFKAEKAIEALQKLVAPQARIVRDGKEQVVAAKELVPGDILILSEGDHVTADAVLFETNELRAQESALTGESVPVRKLTWDTSEPKSMESEKEMRVFMGTAITSGNGKAIVMATGMNTQMGNIAKLTTETKKEASPLEKELRRIGVFVGKVSLLISAVLLGVGVLIQGKGFIDTLLFAVAVAVAAVPEGLPATITIALAIGVQKLAKKNAIMKQLSSVETLGSTTVICSDKTGTLTRNEMTVQELYFDNYNAQVQGVGYQPQGCIVIRKENKGLQEALDFIMKTALLCNNAKLIEEKPQNGNPSKWSILGDPTEGALITLAEKCGFSGATIKAVHKKIREISFDSTRKRMTVIVQEDAGTYLALTKGAPDSILTCCSTTLQDGKEHPLTAEEKEKFLGKNEEMAKRALRVLAFAYRKISAEELRTYEKSGEFPKEKIEKDLILLGLAGMIDPPRPEVKAAVETAKKANIRIYIVTGDHGLTAQAIATELGIISSKRQHRIITGEELQKLQDYDLATLLRNKKLDIIFARVSPEHKLRVVNILKTLNEVVAVTGDGVNDAPALKKADIGIAMGITGTDVSKEAANMVLADDSFATIITAIKEGRTIYDNMKKFVFYIFSCNIGEIVTIFFAILFSLPSPLSAILILFINLGTDVLPAVALGMEPTEPGIMEKKPRDPSEKIMNRPFIERYLYLGVLIGMLVMAVYVWTLYRYGWTWGEPLQDEDIIHLKAASVAFTTLIVIQMINAFNARSETHSIFKLGVFSNLWLLGAITLSLLMTIGMVEIPFIEKFIGTTTLELEDWIVVIGTSGIILAVEEGRKWIVRKELSMLAKA